MRIIHEIKLWQHLLKQISRFNSGPIYDRSKLEDIVVFAGVSRYDFLVLTVLARSTRLDQLLSSILI
jgi:hypothetical protein